MIDWWSVREYSELRLVTMGRVPMVGFDGTAEECSRQIRFVATRPAHSFFQLQYFGVACRRRRASVGQFGHIVAGKN